MTKDTGGCAFPSAPVYDGNGNGIVEGANGMTLRQWYAGMAMQGMMARDSYDSGQATPEKRSKLAFIEADAMILEGSQK